MWYTWYNTSLHNREDQSMAVSYKKLWKLLIDHDMKKRDLEKAAQVSHYTMNKLTHGDNVTTDVLARICFALDADVGDIIQHIVNCNFNTTVFFIDHFCGKLNLINEQIELLVCFCLHNRLYILAECNRIAEFIEPPLIQLDFYDVVICYTL